MLHTIQDHLPLWLLLLPILGMILLGLTRSMGPAASRRTLLVNLLISGLLCVWLVVAYEPLKPATSEEQAAMTGPLDRFQFRDRFAWVGESRTALFEGTLGNGELTTVELPIRWGPDIRFEVGVDGISIWFVALSVLLTAVGISAEVQISKPVVQENALSHSSVGECIVWFSLEASLIGTFVALDVVLFVICWMSTFSSLAWLMGQRGDSLRHAVTPRLLTRAWLGGSLVALGLSGLVLVFGWLRPFPNRLQTPLIFSIPELVTGIERTTAAGENAFLWASISTWLFCLLVLGFTAPLWLVPFHRGFVESLNCAPKGAAIILVGTVSQAAVYGWLRFVVPLFPELLHQHAEAFVMFLGLSSLTAAALAFGASEWRPRIALATCSSLSLSLLGIVTLTVEGLIGGTLRLLSQGLTVPLLIYVLPPAFCRRLDSSVEDSAPQMRRRLLRFGVFAAIGMPGFSGFVAEFVTPFGLIQHDSNAAAFSLATSGLLAWMWVRSERDQPEWWSESWSQSKNWIAGLLIAVNVAFGVAPQFVVDRLQPSLLSLLQESRETSGVSSHVTPVAEVR